MVGENQSGWSNFQGKSSEIHGEIDGEILVS